MEIAAIYMCYKQEEAVVEVLNRFREHYPVAPLLMINDGGSKILGTISTLFHAEYAPCSRTSCCETDFRFTDTYSAVKYVDRIMAALSNSDHCVLLLEDCVWIYGQVPLTDLKFDMSGGHGMRLSNRLALVVKRKRLDLKRTTLTYSDTGGAFLSASFMNSILFDDWKKDIDELLMAQSPITSGELLSCLVYMAGGTVGPYRGYYEPTFLSFKFKKKINWLGGVRILGKEKALLKY